MRTLKQVTLLGFVLLLLSVSCATSQPAQEGGGASGVDTPVETDGTTTIEGVPAMYGSAPRNYVVIVVRDGGEETTYYVHPDYQEAIGTLTGNRYRFTGTAIPKDRFFDARLHDKAFLPESWEAVTPQ
ncbi:MAG: hypothetical protein ACLFSV_11345 [Alkalispirochaeta sp.]